MKYLYIVVLNLFFSYAFSAVPVELNIKMGFGRVEVSIHSPQDQDKQEPLKPLIEKFEIEILTNEKLAPIVMGQENKEYTMIVGYSSDQEFKQTLKEWSNYLFAKASNDLPSESSLVGVLSDGKKRVVMGSHLIVDNGEHLEEVVVIAGSADIKGKVDRLVIIGGDVHLFSTAEITKELNTLGGNVQTDEGALVRGKSVNVGIPLSDESWTMVFNKLKATQIGEFLSSDMTLLVITILKLLSLMLFTYFGYYVAPNYQRKVQIYIQKHSVSCLLWGFFSLFLMVPIVMIMAVSIIGIPLMPLQFTIYFLFFIFGYIHSSLWVMTWIEGKSEFLKKQNLFLKIFLGLLLFEMIVWIPYLGKGFKWLVIFMGFGAASKVFYNQLLLPPSRKLAQIVS
ncbi:MAG: hypothetical protein H6625_01190 [Bdellovibrionaceae bacterium]|nr:hypothetical protein [Pseudobdellovibrionaceae bacterium]